MNSEFPKTLMEFEKQFATEQDCQTYLESVRWPDGFRCPHCQFADAWRTKNRMFSCKRCQRRVSVTAGTVFDRTKQPLTIWFRAMWLLIGEKNGITALGLQRQLGISRYQTAWLMAQKIRKAMIRPQRDPLQSEVEVDETLLGGRRLARGRSKERALVIIAAEADGRKIGRIRMKHIQSPTTDMVETFIIGNIQKSSKVITDGCRAYSGLKFKGYKHKAIMGYSVGEDELLPWVHKIASLLKRWLMGTHHGSVGRKHLQRYLDEFTFRFNRRTSEYRGQLFNRIVGQTIQSGPDHNI